MSSHHFVKEGQEPALIIANGATCSYDLLTSLLEWCPYVVVLDGAYDRVHSLQIRPDVVIGDFDSLSLDMNDFNVEFVQVDDQDTTDLEKGIDFLIAKGFDHINVVWATGRRLDHTVNNFATLARYAELRVVLYDDHSRAFVLPKSYSKLYPPQTKLSLFPMDEASGIETTNLLYNLNNERLKLGERSSSSNQTLEEGLTTISYSEGVLILVESND